VRNPERASQLKARGVDVRQCDFEDPASLTRAFAGVERILIVSTDGDNATRTCPLPAVLGAKISCQAVLV